MSQTNDPFLMKDMELAVQRLERAIDKKEKVLIHGDYDVDGLTSVALLKRALGKLGLVIDHYIPNRLSEGYGVSVEGVKHAKDIGINLIITADCGIVAHEEIKFARTLGLDVIVTDHHEPSLERPSAVAVLNPKQHDCLYPDKELCGL
jgi:single-stranded-DNA-specific exonuclease